MHPSRTRSVTYYNYSRLISYTYAPSHIWREIPPKAPRCLCGLAEVQRIQELTLRSCLIACPGAITVWGVRLGRQAIPCRHKKPTTSTGLAFFGLIRLPASFYSLLVESQGLWTNVQRDTRDGCPYGR
jgi:hypothetical protein